MFVLPRNWSAFLAIAAIGTSPLLHAASTATIEIASGGHARPTTFAQVQLPEEWRASDVIATDAKDHAVPFQIDADGSGWLRVDGLANGETREVTLTRNSSAKQSDPRIIARPNGRKLEFLDGSRHILDYQAEPGEFPRNDIPEVYRRGGYIQSVWSPAGTVVTDDFPANHVHHHAIWFPWTKTKFEGRAPDFWNMGDGKGRVEFVALDRSFSGNLFGGFDARHRFVDLMVEGGETALNEIWNVRVFAMPHDAGVWMFDLESTQTCATDSPLILPEYHYGGLGVRGRGEWNGAANAIFLTSNGETNRVKGNTSRANWCYIGGEINGRQTGIAILSHPDNFRSPQPLRLHPTEPYLCFAPQQLGEMRIEPGEPYVSKYRFLVMDGEPSADRINEYWLDYSEPAKATFVKDGAK